MFERRYLPAVVVALLAALVLVVGLWATESKQTITQQAKINLKISLR